MHICYRVTFLRWPACVAAKEKSFRQKKNPLGKNETGHSKRKQLAAKEKMLAFKGNGSWQKEKRKSM